MPRVEWHCRERRYTFPGRALILGILNVTPDSFSDGTDATPEQFIARGLELAEQGADLIDVGGESTRPGSHPVPAIEQIRRVVPVINALVGQGIAVSIDTTRAEVARRAIELGAVVVNDVSGLTDDAEMSKLVAETGVGVIVMHRQGTPQTMQANPIYQNVVAEVGAFFEERLVTLSTSGIRFEQIALDLGIGFGKTLDHNLTLLAELPAFQRYARPVCLGVSRKGFLGSITGRVVAERDAGSLAVAARALAQNAAQILRVHDVTMTRDCVLLDEAIDARRQT